MNSLKYLGLLAVLPLLTVALTIDYTSEADATKSKGVGAKQYGSATKNKVCGDRLCSETGGKTTLPSVPEEGEDTDKQMKEETMEESTEDEMMASSISFIVVFICSLEDSSISSALAGRYDITIIAVNAKTKNSDLSSKFFILV